ncbi:phosphoenolpyruvate--protein phosphotransferase [Haloferacaceae archaeon DSL9]
MQRLAGTGATPRVGVGTVRWYRPETTLSDPPAPETVDEAAERERFDAARRAAREELEAERERTRERVGDEEAAVFDAHIQFVGDPQIESAVEDALTEGLPAPHAVDNAFEEPIARFESMEGMMAERADDLRDVRDRLLRILTGGERTALDELPDGTVLLAERLTPSDTAQLNPERIAGIATVVGGRTSHAAIIARSLGIPAVVGVGDALSAIEDGEELVVDGDAGAVIREPSAAETERAREETTAAIIDEAVATADGRAIEVAANVGTAAELDPAVEQGADGIGLFRTEFLFLDRESPPDEDEQFETYRAALEAFDGGRVIVRTLDVGGDKPIEYLDLDPVENGFLGARGIRLSLDEHAELFETQLRALLRAAATDAGADLAVMFPLVSTAEELDAALARVDAVAADLDAAGIDAATPELGVMIETPAAVLCADALASRVDFLSIGTNDLAQYVMAAQRDIDRTSSLQDPLQPAVLRAIERTVRAGRDGDAWVGMCGEMAGDPELTRLLVGLGLDELSMSAVTIPDVKAAIRAVETEDAEAYAARVLDAETRDAVDAALERGE